MERAPSYDWDEVKRARNITEHKVDFAEVEKFEWDSAIITIDDREDYGELRERAWGFIGDRVYLLVYTHRGDTVRVISLRKADKKESRQYGRSIKGRMGRSSPSSAARGTRDDRRRRRRD